MDDEDFLYELRSHGAKYMDRHLSTTKEWFPHEYIPWERGAELDLKAEWSPLDYPVPDAVRSALFVNLLTEDNLPYYYDTINRVFSHDDVWGEWNRRWTAEEQRHSIVIRDYLTITNAVDPYELERARMAQVSGGVVPEPPNVPETFSYVALQELATRISHRNTGKMLEDPAGYQVMARVAQDENFHYLFYRDMMTACFELNPSASVIAVEKQVRDFEMPGTGIANFHQHAKAIADAGIYDLILHHEQILVPVVLRTWNVAELENLTPEAEEAREALVSRIDRIGRIATKLKDKREAIDLAAAEGDPAPANV